MKPPKKAAANKTTKKAPVKKAAAKRTTGKKAAGRPGRTAGAG
ncbi:hypothetical protein [Streptomyces sp. NPDC057909]